MSWNNDRPSVAFTPCTRRRRRSSSTAFTMVPLPQSAQSVVEHIGDHADIILPLANGEPVELMDAIEANAHRWSHVRVHQMHALHDRRYLHGAFGDSLQHVSYFLSKVTRPCF